ncbi:hypothetical protein [Agaribacterium sp. ZY112]|uniref:hypothetical protein n=1 Tax=Agaribacterium sp. ZY112 TaxID=3233574 RepID=UPI0035231CCE
MNLSRRQQSIFVIAGAVLVVLASTVTVMVNIELEKRQALEKVAYQNHTFTDASLLCEDELRSEFASDLTQHYVDMHSSRYDELENAFKVFMVASLGSGKNAADVYVTCEVSARTGNIKVFEFIDTGDSSANKSKAIRKGGEKFIEWPQ